MRFLLFLLLLLVTACAQQPHRGSTLQASPVVLQPTSYPTSSGTACPAVSGGETKAWAGFRRDGRRDIASTPTELADILARDNGQELTVSAACYAELVFEALGMAKEEGVGTLIALLRGGQVTSVDCVDNKVIMGRIASNGTLDGFMRKCYPHEKFFAL